MRAFSLIAVLVCIAMIGAAPVENDASAEAIAHHAEGYVMSLIDLSYSTWWF